MTCAYINEDVPDRRKHVESHILELILLLRCNKSYKETGKKRMLLK